MKTIEGLAQTTEELAQVRAYRLQNVLLALADTYPRLRPSVEGSGSLIRARMDNWVSHGRFAPPPFVPLFGWLRFTYGIEVAASFTAGMPPCHEKFFRLLGLPSRPLGECRELTLPYLCYSYEEEFIHGVEKVVENIWHPDTFGPASMTRHLFGS